MKLKDIKESKFHSFNRLNFFLNNFYFHRLKQIAVEKPWTIQDSLGMKIDYGKKQSEISMDITSQTNISKEKSLFSQLEQ